MSDPSTAGPLAGRLLVATPLLGDPNFDRTVVLMLAHGAEGALGLVLNRPTATRADELVPGWGERVAPPAVMFLGGPVGQNGVIGLHPGGTIDLNVPPEETVDPPDTLRLFAGSAGWGAGPARGRAHRGGVVGARRRARRRLRRPPRTTSGRRSSAASAAPSPGSPTTPRTPP